MSYHFLSNDELHHKSIEIQENNYKNLNKINELQYNMKMSMYELIESSKAI